MIFLYVCIAILCVIIMIQDIRNRQVDTVWAVLLFGLCVFVWAVQGTDISVLINLCMVFAIGLVLFAFKIFGAMDIKAIMCYVLIIPADSIWIYLFLITLVGSIFSIYLAIKQYGKKKTFTYNAGVPYLVPINCVTLLFIAENIMIT